MVVQKNDRSKERLSYKNSKGDIMKSLLRTIVVYLIMAAYLPIYGQEGLERKIEMIFRYDPVEGEKYDAKAKIEELGSRDEVGLILLGMLKKYKHSEPGSMEYIYLNGASWVLGGLRDQRATNLLSQMLFDAKTHENVRALAARSLGQINAEGNKQLLLKALANKDDYFQVRVYAAEALGKTKDSEVLKALEKYSQEEKDSHVKQQFEKAARELSGKLRRPQ